MYRYKRAPLRQASALRRATKLRRRLGGVLFGPPPSRPDWVRQDYYAQWLVELSGGGPLTAKSFHTLFARIGPRAKLPFPVHPQMLRHACGYALANAGHDTRALQAYLGHKNIQHTVRYSELAADRFKNFWRL